MKYSSANKPFVCMMTSSTCYRSTRTMVPKGVLWHSTGANNPTLRRYVQPSDNASNRTALLQKLGTNSNGNDWNHIRIDAGLNGWIGKFADGSVGTVQTMPWNYRPWGCGSGRNGSCNDGWIQFEICEDALTDKAYFDKVYKEACELTAYLCKMYKLNPKGTVIHNGVKVPVILCHIDSYNLGLGSAHSDVMHWFKRYGKTMDDVRNDVYSLMYSAPKVATKYTLVAKVNKYATAADAKAKVKATGKVGKGTYYLYSKYPKGYNGMYNVTKDKTGAKAGFWINPAENVKLPVAKKYTVRKTKNDTKSQKGTFNLLTKAKECCQQAGAGYHVFNKKGKIVYSYKKKKK